MISTGIHYFILVIFSVLIIRAKYRSCDGLAEYASCSTHSACICFRTITSPSSSICADEFLLSCSELVQCEGLNNTCDESEHFCVNHPRCHDFPICYPVPNFNEQLCPPISTTTTTTTASTTTTTTASTTTTTTASTTTTTTASTTTRPLLQRQPQRRPLLQRQRQPQR
ncbi:unnamed protein product [Rotaria magnacalcarata]|uniref:Uncharacterized protein n=1 Tax=Rotaria magnacalcarata TaxID=392030 RepID=A0A816D5W3_9BILA|nr:unnamed protein product [Rotaria magnacalcarata]